MIEIPVPPSDAHAVAVALAGDAPDERTFVTLARADSARHLESLARRARALTRHHFGRTIQLYAPLYLSSFCSSGCAYCGFAADRRHPRRRLELPELAEELAALKDMGFEQILLLTGERAPQADFDYLLTCVRAAAAIFHEVAIEAFPMTQEEYRQLVLAGCCGVTIYQETYDAVAYAKWHRWGPKRDYAARLDAPSHALAAGMRGVCLGVLLGLADPRADALALYGHVRDLQARHWRASFSVSFPRLRPEVGGFQAPHPVDDRLLAQLVFAFRICLPETSLTLSTRESPLLRDGLAGLGINRMSVASRTTVGGYAGAAAAAGGEQFAVFDERTAAEFCDALRGRGLDPVFKNWDALYRGGEA